MPTTSQFKIIVGSEEGVTLVLPIEADLQFEIDLDHLQEHYGLKVLDDVSGIQIRLNTGDLTTEELHAHLDPMVATLLYRRMNI